MFDIGINNSDLPDLSTLRILIAEDNELTVDAFDIFLRGKVLEYDIALNGRLALELFKKKKYDLAVLNWGMPELDGLSTLYGIRYHEVSVGLPRTPTIMLTASPEYEVFFCSCMALGATLCKTLPITQTSLFNFIKQALDQSTRLLN